MGKKVTLDDLLFALKLGLKVVRPISPFGLGIGLTKLTK